MLTESLEYVYVLELIFGDFDCGRGESQMERVSGILKYLLRRLK